MASAHPEGPQVVPGSAGDLRITPAPGAALSMAPVYWLITVCAHCECTMSMQPVRLEPMAVSHGICDRCYASVVEPQLAAMRKGGPA